jgi:hypothetical protein
MMKQAAIHGSMDERKRSQPGSRCQAQLTTGRMVLFEGANMGKGTSWDTEDVFVYHRRLGWRWLSVMTGVLFLAFDV